jgi:hypothetical protein
LAADPAGTLRQIAAIGYGNIELAGPAGLTAAQFRACGPERLNIVGADKHPRIRNNLTRR